MADAAARPDAPWAPESVVGRLAGVVHGNELHPFLPGVTQRMWSVTQWSFWALLFPLLKRLRHALRAIPSTKFLARARHGTESDK